MNENYEKIILEKRKKVNLLYGLHYVVIIFLSFVIIVDIFFFIKFKSNSIENEGLGLFIILFFNVSLTTIIVLWYYLDFKSNLRKFNLSSHHEVRNFEEYIIFTENYINIKCRYIKDINIHKLPQGVIDINNNTAKIYYKDIRIIVSSFSSFYSFSPHSNKYWIGFNLNGDIKNWEPKYFGGLLTSEEFNLIIEFLKKKVNIKEIRHIEKEVYYIINEKTKVEQDVL